MQRAKSYGIDAFALNIGVDPYTDQQLGYAYQSAANNGMKVFISFDFNWWTTSQATQVGQKIAQYASLPAQLQVDGKVFVSSFAGDGLDVATMRSAAGVPLFFAPNFHPSEGTDISTVDGLLNWMAWPNNGNNKAPTSGSNVTVAAGDQQYTNALAGKAYIARKSDYRRCDTQVLTSVIDSCLALVLHSLRTGSIVQQELGLPLGLVMVQPVGGITDLGASLCRNSDME
jgi:hypothetical protein